jgi:hypothetical protein
MAMLFAATSSGSRLGARLADTSARGMRGEDYQERGDLGRAHVLGVSPERAAERCSPSAEVDTLDARAGVRDHRFSATGDGRDGCRLGPKAGPAARMAPRTPKRGASGLTTVGSWANLNQEVAVMPSRCAYSDPAEVQETPCRDHCDVLERLANRRGTRARHHALANAAPASNRTGGAPSVSHLLSSPLSRSALVRQHCVHHYASSPYISNPLSPIGLSPPREVQ